jgi:hypothetical protein
VHNLSRGLVDDSCTSRHIQFENIMLELALYCLWFPAEISQRQFEHNMIDGKIACPKSTLSVIFMMIGQVVLRE